MLMVFPLNSKPDWRNPPWVTIFLILVNCLIYFGPQRSDEQRADQAMQAYASGPLAKIELPRYADYLEQQQDHSKGKAEWFREAATTQYAGVAGEVMERDTSFMLELRAGRIVRSEEPDYANWRQAREQQDAIRGEEFTRKWASNPANWEPITMLTSVFLHGSVMHLVGNMIFLFAFGYTVEMSLGASRYLIFYLLAGASGDLGDLLVRLGQDNIGLGASGAISGLMTLYAMLYGWRRIKFFYQFLFYFDYVTAPAIILIPFWIADQAWLQITQPNSGVAYMAHLGGLLGGTLLGAWFKWQRRGTEIKLLEPPPPDPFPAALAHAMGLVKAMKMEAARDAFARLVLMRPAETELLARYFNLARSQPADKHFHRAAALIFALKGKDPLTSELVRKTLQQYLSEARPRPRLAAETLARLAMRMSAEGQVALAEQVTGILLQLSPVVPQAATIIFALAHMHQRKGNQERTAHWLRILREQYPQSPEARLNL